MGSKIRKDFEGVVHAYNDGGAVAVLAAGDKVPDGFFVGDHLLKAAKDDDESTEPVIPTEKAPPAPPAEPVPPVDASGQPPRNGAGSSKDAWAAYAETVGVATEADWGRDDIIAAVDAAAS